MLFSLYVENVLLIERLSISFCQGFSVIVGETGSGKSIILDCLNIILGDRTRSNMIRPGTDKAMIVAEFEIKDNHNVHKILAQNSIQCPDDILIIKKIITSDGRSRIYICDIPASINLAADITKKIIEVNSQFSQNDMLDPKEYLNILDKYTNISEDIDILRSAFDTYIGSQKELDQLLEKQNQLDKTASFYREIINDIGSIDPKENEEVDLVLKRSSSAIHSRTVNLIRNALDKISSLKIEQQLGSIESSLLRGTVNLDDKMRSEISIIIEDISFCNHKIEEIKDRFGKIILTYSSQDNVLEKIDDRIQLLRDISRKYHVQSNQLVGLLEDAKKNIEIEENLNEKISEARNGFEIAYNNYIKAATKVSSKRKEFAKILEKEILKHMIDLKLSNARFSIRITTDQKNMSKTGIDNVEFLVSMNNGMPLTAIHQVASGGEISRFMLAFKVVSAKASGIRSIIFDEIDTGISGQIATIVGEKMKYLANQIQVIAVTHSPQVTSCASHFLKVQKSSNDSIANMTIICLKEEADIVNEIAGMISGNKVTDASISAARQLLCETK